MIGFRSGRLLVVGQAASVNRRAMWRCRCDCGSEVVRMGKYLRGFEVKSCGCLNRQGIDGPANYRHGHAIGGQSAEYRSWAGMLDRCRNPRSKNWDDYGGRGIKVCRRWQDREGFANFLADMGGRPKGKTLDRWLNNGNYAPSNCRWATRHEQMSNTRKTRWIEHDGQRMTLSQWARRLGVKSSTLHSRLSKHPIEKVLP